MILFFNFLHVQEVDQHSESIQTFMIHHCWSFSLCPYHVLISHKNWHCCSSFFQKPWKSYTLPILLLFLFGVSFLDAVDTIYSLNSIDISNLLMLLILFDSPQLTFLHDTFFHFDCSDKIFVDQVGLIWLY